MSLIPQFYSSADPGAPALTGQPGSLVDLLDAVLVDGYGSGETARDSAGWSVQFEAGNRRAYRNGTTYGSGHLLQVDDSAMNGNARHAWWRCYESMMDIDNGDGAAPTTAQRPFGQMVIKSLTLSSAERAWSMFACESFFYLNVNPDGEGSGRFSAQTPYMTFFAGNFQSRMPGDSGNFSVMASLANTFSGVGGNYGPFEGMSNIYTHYPSSARCYVVRSASGQLSNPVGLILPGDPSPSYGPGAATGTAIRGAGPDPVSGGIAIQRISIVDGVHSIRGYLPNIYAPLRQFPAEHGEVITGVGGTPPGTELYAHLNSFRTSPSNTNGYGGMVFFDLTNAWWSA